MMNLRPTAGPPTGAAPDVSAVINTTVGVALQICCVLGAGIVVLGVQMYSQPLQAKAFGCPAATSQLSGLLQSGQMGFFISQV